MSLSCIVLVNLKETIQRLFKLKKMNHLVHPEALRKKCMNHYIDLGQLMCHYLYAQLAISNNKFQFY